jgi:hypothetical protein
MHFEGAAAVHWRRTLHSDGTAWLCRPSSDCEYMRRACLMHYKKRSLRACALAQLALCAAPARHGSRLRPTRSRAMPAYVVYMHAMQHSPPAP